MNINTNTEVTLYDFLNYEVIGVLMLFLCNITPQTISPNWLFFVYAFIEGFVFSKLVENSFWTKFTRNPKCIIKNARKKVFCAKKDGCLNRYYKSYYRISKIETYKTIQILEAQYTFVHNLLIVCIVYYIVVRFSRDYFNELFVSNESIGLCSCCKQCVMKNTIPNTINLMPIIVSNIILLFCCIFKWISCFGTCIKRKQEKEEKEQSCLLIKAMFALVVLVFTVLMIRDNNNHTFDVFICGLSFLIILLPFLAYNIQLKISILVIEGAHYLKELEKEEHDNLCKKDNSNSKNNQNQ